MFKFGSKNLRDFSNIVATGLVSKRKTCEEFYNVYKNINIIDNVNKHNFIQSRILGNCVMVASMATLGGNRELYNKVAPNGQNFSVSLKAKTSSKFEFNLYIFGKLHKVIVDANLKSDGKGLIYSKKFK